MIDTVIERIQLLDPDHEYRALSAHAAVTSPVALELLAYEHLSSPAQEASRIAAIQLRVVSELAGKLRWLESVCIDPGIAPELRVALSAILRELCAETELLPVVDSEAAVFLEPAVLFHMLLANLRPWLPPMVLELEPDAVLDMLQLGIPDYLHPLLVRRFESICQLFHQLRSLPRERLAHLEGFRSVDEVELERLTLAARSLDETTPPAPRWDTPQWVSPWLDLGSAVPRPANRRPSNELAS